MALTSSHIDDISIDEPPASRPRRHPADLLQLMVAMTALGLDGATAVSATFLYHIATLWLPILPGTRAMRKLERDGLL